MLKGARQFAVLGTRAAACTILVSFLPLPGPVQAQDADPGQQTFQTLCSACHTIGGGSLVGPDLKGVEERRSEAWIIGFVQHSQQMVASGDADAMAIFEEYNRIPMPDQPLTEAEILAVLDYVQGTPTTGEPPPERSSATEEQVRLGRDLFQGTARFTNNGPPCNSCHEVRSESVIGGGLLAPELTSVISRVGAPGVWAMIRRPPFPLMQTPYEDRPLTDDEVTALVGFLERADVEQAMYEPRDYGIKLLFAGIVGTALLLGLYTLLWRKRRKGTVHQTIFDRQVRSA
ncbi:MAG: cytochrome c [Gemmatimonadetes bacterium]|nr:cytochrome c [Gemmatimonadota bacterium]